MTWFSACCRRSASQVPSRGGRYRAAPLAEPSVRALTHLAPPLAGSQAAKDRMPRAAATEATARTAIRD